MKIVYVTVTMPFREGEEFLIPEARELLRQGHDILIVHRSSSGDLINGDATSLSNVSIKQTLFSKPNEIISGNPHKDRLDSYQKCLDYFTEYPFGLGIGATTSRVDSAGAYPGRQVVVHTFWLLLGIIDSRSVSAIRS